MDVVAKWSERLQARCDLVLRSGFAGNPVLLGNSVAVEPEYKARLDLFSCSFAGRGVCSAAGVEHRLKRRQPDTDQRTGGSDASKERAPRESFTQHQSGPPRN